MHDQMRVPSLFLLLFLLSGPTYGQVRDPISEPIIKRGLSVEIREIARLPDTSRIYPSDQHRTGYARVNYVRDLADGRRLANDTRGFLYLLDSDNQPSLYLDVGALFPLSHYNGNSAGFTGFNFHPEFSRNGLFYTAHIERAMRNPVPPTLYHRDLPRKIPTIISLLMNGVPLTLLPTSSRVVVVSCCASVMRWSQRDIL
jgi:hypothetical protein